VNDIAWVLLIYLVPATPSRKRAAIWRELKKIGSVYLRDGVCVLPARPETAAALRAIAVRVEEFGGQATLVENAQLDSRRADTVIAQARAARASEYADILREVEQLWEYLQREPTHRQFTSSEVDELLADLGKLERWSQQVTARDYFGHGPDEALMQLFARCQETIEALRGAAAFPEFAR
jgi:hypothetical protein